MRLVAQRAEALGFRDLWVTENTLNHVFCFDPVVVLTYAAAVTTTIRLGVSVVVLPMHHPAHVAHQWASSTMSAAAAQSSASDWAATITIPSSAYRVRAGCGGSRANPAVRALWSEPRVDFRGSLYQLEGGTMLPKPVQKPLLPIWMGVGHPDAVRRAAALADGWMGSGGSSIAAFSRSVPILRAALEKAGRDPAGFPISKRLFMAVDERPERARAELDRWFTEVYHNPEGTDASGIPAPRNRSASGSRSWWRWAPTTCS